MRPRAMILVAAIFMAGAASAYTIDNGPFGPNIKPIGGLFGSDVYGQSFIAPADNLLVKFGMWLQDGSGEPPSVRIDLWADDGLNHPDESNILVAGTVHQGVLADLTRIDTVTSFLLNPGERYWVTINGIIDQTSTGYYTSTWDEYANTVSNGSMEWSNELGAVWSGDIVDGDFGVYVETARPTPVPGTMLLLGSGLAGLVVHARRRKKH